MSKKVLILWANDRSSNLGVQALARGSSVLAETAFPGCDTEFLSYGDELLLGQKLGAKFLLGAAFWPRSDAVKAVKKFDLVIDTGAGDSFADIYGFRRLAEMSLMRRLVSRANVAFVMGPQTIGPFRQIVTIALAKLSVRKASLIIARDPTSAGIANASFRSPVVQTTDVVFLLPRYSTPLKYDLLLNVSGLLWNENPHVPHQLYRLLVSTLIGKCIDAGIEVTLMSHVIDSEDKDNDSPAVAAAAALFPEQSIHTVSPVSLSDAREHIAGARVVVASRMHAALNALSQGVPAIAWSYSRKFAPLLLDIGWHEVVELQEVRQTDVDRVVHDTVNRCLSLRTDGSAASRCAELARSEFEPALAAIRKVTA